MHLWLVSIRYIYALFRFYDSTVSPAFGDLGLTSDQRKWLESTCPFFTKDYLDYLSVFRFKPEQVQVTFIPTLEGGDTGQIEMIASGLWVETILWEVPLMAILSESYFQVDDTDWSYDGQKGCQLVNVFAKLYQ